VTPAWSAVADDAAAMDRLGRALGSHAPEGAVLLLEGPLGAGKTTLAQGVARGCGVEAPVASPTYNLVLHYSGRRPFTHVDLYRLEGADDLATLDLDEIAGGEGVTCVEWPALVRAEVRPPWSEIEIRRAPLASAPQRRHVAARWAGPGWERAAAALAEAGARMEASGGA